MGHFNYRLINKVTQPFTKSPMEFLKQLLERNLFWDCMDSLGALSPLKNWNYFVDSHQQAVPNLSQIYVVLLAKSFVVG